MRRLSMLPLLLLPLAGCDQVNQTLGLEDVAKKEARQEAEGRAVGGACRQSGRAIEDCYSIYSWLPKSAVYAGWRDMDAYMRENKIETVEPQLPPAEPPGARKRRRSAEEEEGAEEKPARAPVKAQKNAAETAAEKPAEAGAEKSASEKTAGDKPADKPADKSAEKTPAAPAKPAPPAPAK